MRNIFIFIRRYFTFLSFLTLQIICIVFLVNFNTTHKAVFAGVASEITGSVNTEVNKVQNYFHLRENNRLLLEENTRLKNMLGVNFEAPDTIRQAIIDSIYRDTTGRQRKFIWLPAKVVNSSVSGQLNYITLHRGSAQGIKKDMAVVGPQGTVGVVIDVSENYAKVMSMLHQNSILSAMLKKNAISGRISWNGEDPRYVTLNGIPKTTALKKGDTVVTSQYSSTFPPNIMVGSVEEVKKDPASNYFIIKIKTSTDFYTLEYVNVVENAQLTEQRKLEQAPVKNQ